ncbi:MAG: glycosyltransferase family 2 protein [Chloroflexia bacterium]|nr:glycosyltransferase family 2 protein [Chloroflexia bacterium]
MNRTRPRQQGAADSWLTDDLVIASRERQREPELAAATIEAAMAAPLPTRSARYDVIVLPGSSQATTTSLNLLERLFTAHHHRVFWLDGASQPTLDRLAALRQAEGIAAAILVTADASRPDVVQEARARWGWRGVAIATSGADLRGIDVPLPPAQIAAAVEEISAAEPEATPAAAWSTIDRAIRAAFPKASVAVLTHDNLAFTRLCLESLLANTEYPNYELLIVDNASADGTPAYLRELGQRFPWVRPIFNDRNAGFGPGNNQALAAATGEILVLLNNDTMLPRGWLSRLAHHLTDPRLGLIGPATNRTCNEAQVEAPYATYGDFLRFAEARAVTYDGMRHEIRMPMMFCTAFRRDILDQIGPLDERFETGMFEDEDYALRVQAAGFQVAWAPDVYVHHAYHASIGKLLPSGRYTALFKANQQRFEEKWGICWERHRPAPTAPSPLATAGCIDPDI